MLPQDPPPKVMRFIAWLLIVMFAVALFGRGSLCSFLKRSRRIYPRAARTEPIRFSRRACCGKSRFSVTEGQTVKAGRNCLFCARTKSAAFGHSAADIGGGFANA